MAANPQTPARGPFTLAFSLGSIPVEIEPSFWIMGLLFGSSAGLEAAAVWTGVLLISVLLHELGHALAAMAFGSRVHIRLYSLGGLTYHQRLPRFASILTSFAGPIAGFTLGGAILLYEHLVPVDNERLDWLLAQFKWVNLVWGGINLLPVLPLDGGHVLTGVLGEKRIRIALVISAIVGGLVATVAMLGIPMPDGRVLRLYFVGIMFGFLAVRSAIAFSQLSRAGVPPAPESEDAAPAEPANTLGALLESGWHALSRGDDAAAERAAREVLTSTEELELRNGAVDLLAWVELARGDASAALRQLERVRPAEQVRALTRALALEASGELTRALPLALEAHAKEPSESSAQLAIRLLTHDGRYDDAEQIAESFQWPRQGSREASLGGVRHARGDFVNAAKLLQLAFELRQRAIDAFNAACSLARAGDSAGALAWLGRSVDAGLDDPSLLETDPDLEPTRRLPGFTELLNRARVRRQPA